MLCTKEKKPDSIIHTCHSIVITRKQLNGVFIFVKRISISNEVKKTKGEFHSSQLRIIIQETDSEARRTLPPVRS